jgi:HK97 family phage portal protein
MRIGGLNITWGSKAKEIMVQSPPTPTYLPNRSQWSEWNIPEFYGAYANNPFVYRVVNYIMNSCASVDTYYTNQKGEPIEDHPAIALMERPNPNQSKRQFVRDFIMHYVLGGQAFGYALDPSGTGAKNPVQIYPFGANLMTPKPPATLGKVAGFVYKPKGQEIDLTADQVFWFASPHPSNLFDGLPGTKAADKSIDADNAWLTYIRDLNISGGIGAQVLVPNEGVTYTTEQQKTMKESFYAREKAKLMIASSRGEMKPLGWSPKDLDTGMMEDKLVRSICVAYGFSPILLGEAATFANYETARAQFYLETVLPLLDILYPALSMWLSMRFGTPIQMKYDKDKIDALSVVRRAKWAATGQAYRGDMLITLDEAREEIGYGSATDDKDIQDVDGNTFYKPPFNSFGQGAVVTDNGKSWTISNTKGSKCRHS